MDVIMLDPDTHDWKFENNQLVMLKEPDATVQRLRCRLKAFRGEWFLDTTVGLPFYQVIFVKAVALNRVASAIKYEIVTTPGVILLRSYQQTLDRATRRLTVIFEVMATNGDIIQLTEVIGA